MADAITNLKSILRSQYYDEDKWAFNKKALQALGFFSASVFVLRNFGDAMAI